MVKQMQPGERSLRRCSLKKACLHVFFEHLAKMETDSQLKAAHAAEIVAQTKLEAHENTTKDFGFFTLNATKETAKLKLVQL